MLAQILRTNLERFLGNCRAPGLSARQIATGLENNMYPSWVYGKLTYIHVVDLYFTAARRI